MTKTRRLPPSWSVQVPVRPVVLDSQRYLPPSTRVSGRPQGQLAEKGAAAWPKEFAGTLSNGIRWTESIAERYAAWGQPFAHRYRHNACGAVHAAPTSSTFVGGFLAALPEASIAAASR